MGIEQFYNQAKDLTHREIIECLGGYADRNLGCVTGLLERGGYCGGGESPDYIGFNAKGESFLIEVKISRADFQADKKKLFRKFPKAGVGKYRYFACPDGLITPEELPEGWGLIYIKDKSTIRKKKSSDEFERKEDVVCSEIGYLTRALRDVRVGVMIVRDSEK